MKYIYTRYCIFAFIFCLNSASLSAATLYVDEDGSSDYYSIQEAVDACSPGDRIVVVPKSGGAAYENLFINKNNIEIVSSEENTRYKISGLITINGSSIKLINCEYSGDSYWNWAALNISGNDVDIVYCKFNYCRLKNTNGNVNLHLYSDTLTNCSVETFGSVIIAGCMLYVDYPATDNYLYKFDLNFGELEFIGNHLQMYFVYDFDMIIGHSSGNAYIKIMNNFLDDLGGSTTNGFTYTASTMFPSTTKPLVFENNSFRSSGSVDKMLEINLYIEQPLVVKNNVFDCDGYCLLSAYVPSNPIFRYNHFSRVYGIFFPTVDYTNNVTTSNTLNNLGYNSPGSAAINGGDPGPKYLDLDLTRNDAGCYGGSYSRTNFQSAETGARVLMMHAKRVVYAGQSIDVTAEGVDR